MSNTDWPRMRLIDKVPPKKPEALQLISVYGGEASTVVTVRFDRIMTDEEAARFREYMEAFK